MVRMLCVNGVSRIRKGIFGLRKVRVNKRVAMVVAVMDVKERSGNQCEKHSAHREPSAKSTHGQHFPVPNVRKSITNPFSPKAPSRVRCIWEFLGPSVGVGVIHNRHRTTVPSTSEP